MSILSSIGRIATEYSAARARARSERLLRSLSPDLRKDIGWPEPETAYGRSNHPFGPIARANTLNP